MARWTVRPQGSTWGDFGPDDRFGRLNLLGPAALAAGMAEVRDHRNFLLSLPLEYPGGNVLNARRKPPELSPVLRDGAPLYDYPLSSAGGHAATATDVLNDDKVVLHNHYSTHWDAFCHCGQMFDVHGTGTPKPVFYNGFGTGVGERLGVEVLAERMMQGRAVLIDLARVFGTERQYLRQDDIVRAMAETRAEVRPGDIVCFHTGFADALLEAGGHPSAALAETFGAVLDGRDPALLDWITKAGIVAIAADNYSVEGLPAVPRAECSSALPLHAHCLFKLGVPLGELWHLGPLAAHLAAVGRTAFLLTAPPLRLTGASGAPTSPIATV